MCASKCVPAEATSSRRAARTVNACLYGRAAVMVSNASATATIRPPNAIWSPSSPWGYPVPSTRSW